MLSPATKAAAGVTKVLAEHDVRSDADRALNKAEDGAHKVIDDLTHRASEAGAKVRTFFDDAQGHLNTAGGRLNKEVHDNPVRTGLLALGAGVLLGMLIKR
ncbi:hypothetical protein [Asticcacaulis sp. YBE204]|uniref:hypothetical protein n=1 Tax=Asticcacaulis sp. YBE204 TaxID=1282363 RepID=UPI0003C3EA78|nr:hypothetical protein [Asticcacaulis sp. YBE204]ESQ81276.1 hypothetical protein AEYBE204_02755 [Asticcacaulis sp. YBE204]